MDNSVVRGMVPRSDVIDVPDDLRRKLRWLANGARLRLDRHSERIRSDSEYREAVQHLIELLSALPGRFGQTARIAAAGHTLLIKVL